MKWEYKTTKRPSELNELGIEGWELVSVVRVDDNRGNFIETFYLKRALVNPLA